MDFSLANFPVLTNSSSSSRNRLAAKIGNTNEAVELLKTITKEMHEQGEFAKAVAESNSKDMTPFRKERIQQKLVRFGELPTELVTSTKSALKAQNNPEELEKMLRQLDRHVNEAKLVSSDLADMCSMGTEAQVLNTATNIDQDSSRLQKSIVKDPIDPDEVTLLMKRLAKNADMIADLSNEVSSNPTISSTKKAVIKQLGSEIPTQTQHVVKAIRDAIITPSHDTKQAVVLQINHLKDANKRFLEQALQNPEDQMAQVEIDLLQQLETFRQTVNSGTEKEVRKGLEELEHTRAKQRMLAETILSSSKDDIQKRDIQNALTDLDAFWTSKFVPSVEQKLKDPNNPAFLKKVDENINEAKQKVSKVTRASAASPEARMLHNLHSAFEARDKLYQAALDGNKKDVSKYFQEYKQPILQHLQMARSQAAALDEESRRKVEQLASEIEGLLGELEKALDELAANPNSKELREKVLGILQKIDDRVLELGKILHPQVEKTIIANDELLIKEVDQLVQSVKKVDDLEAKLAQKRIVNKLTEQTVLGRMMSTNLEPAMHDSDKKNLQVTLKNMQGHIQEVGPLPLLPKSMDKVTSATEKAKATDKTLVDIARKNLALREKRIEDEIEKQRQLEIEREKKEREEREKRKKEEELRLQQEEADRQKMLMAEKEDTNKDDVHLAAKEVSVSAQKTIQKLGKDFDLNTPEGRLFNAAKKIGELMELLSDAALRNSKADMIKYAKEIVAAAKDILLNATEQANKCTDVKLKEQLLTQAQQASSISVQLKIITAVKATTEDKDSSSKHIKLQLVKCAKSLAGSVVKTLTYSEIAAIKSKK